MSSRDAIAKSFELNDGEHSSVIDELHSLCRIYNLNAEDLKFKWEAFSINMGSIVAPTVGLVRQLKSSLQFEFQQKLQTKSRSEPSNQAPKYGGIAFSIPMEEDTGADILGAFMSNWSGSSAKSNLKKQQEALAPSSILLKQQSKASAELDNRIGANIVDSQFNGHLDLPKQRPNTSANTTVRILQPPIPKYRYMFEKISEKSEGLDEQIEFIGDVIGKHYNVETYANPLKASQSQVTAVGRVCCDSSGVKLNKTSVVLETTRELGMGKRVKLDLKNVEEYSLFPGQIVAVRGTNNTGKAFTVDSIITPPLPPVLPRKEKEIYKYSMESGADNQPVDIVVTSGPYTLDDDLSYKTLGAFIQTCIAQKPDVVILMGPFVPESHPIIASGALDVTPQDVFREQVAKRINNLSTASPSTQILLMPHADDLIHEYPLFPQPQLNKDGLGLGNVQTLSNPSLIEINGSRFAIGNIDILFSMSKEEIFGTIPHQDRLGRLTRHVLEQRSFYPLFPSAIHDSIDSSRFPDLLISESPDFLILPSQLKQFTKKIDDVIAINPGYLSKRRTPGTYARILIHPATELNNNIDGQTKTWERTRIDLVRL